MFVVEYVVVKKDRLNITEYINYAVRVILKYYYNNKDIMLKKSYYHNNK